MPALTRLLVEGHRGCLVTFEVLNDSDALPLTPAFVAAVHASRLQRLVLSEVRLF